MGYSGYGGYAYRDGVRIETASDALLTPDCINHGTPGGFPPGDLMVRANDDPATAIYGHVVIGDGPVFVTLLKFTLSIHLLANGAFHDLNLQTIGVDLPEDVVIDFGDGTCILDADRLVEHPDILRFAVDGHVIEYRMVAHPRWVQHVRITHPDGTVWSGFCGMEIGAGHDDEDTQPIADRHLKLFSVTD